MPEELIAISPGKAILKNYEEEPLKANQIRIKSTISAEKNGARLSDFNRTYQFKNQYNFL
ncbi:hypothetical protein J7K25_04880 [bacterium]|nr:hypothetical protein [bacterium]